MKHYCRNLLHLNRLQSASYLMLSKFWYNSCVKRKHFCQDFGWEKIEKNIIDYKLSNKPKKIMDSSEVNPVIQTTGVAIIGAGIAGLGAAVTLEKNSFTDYKIIEAQPHVGGRIHSVRWNDGWLEEGAQYLHGTNSQLAQLAEEKGLLSDAFAAEGQGLYLREDGSEMDKALVLEVDDVIKNIMEDCEKYSKNSEIEFVNVEENMSKVVRSRFLRYLKSRNDSPNIRKAKEELFNWNIRFLIIDNACNSLDELSLRSWGKFKAVNGPEHNLFLSHYSTIVEYLTNELSQDNILLSSPVKKIEWNDCAKRKCIKPISIYLDGNKKILADCAIVTCSLGFLKENHYSLFRPSLPKSHVTAIESLGFGMINKIFLDFDEPWWENDVKGFQFLWKAENSCEDKSKNKLPSWVFDLTGFDVVHGHRGVLLGWIGGKGARVVETLTDHQIIKGCKDLFEFFLKNKNVSEARKCMVSRWAKNQFVRGGYCHISKNCDANGVSPATLAEPIWAKLNNAEGGEKSRPVIMLAGEATHECYYSTTHGAYDTGVKQAQIFLNSL